MKRWSVVCVAEKFDANRNENNVEVIHDVNIYASDEDTAHGITVRGVMRQLPGHRIAAMSIKEI